MTDVKIVIDNSADMPKEILDRYDLGLVNFMSVFGEKAYVAGVDITNDEFYEMLENYDGVPTTSQTAYADLYDYFLEQARKYKSVIYFTISSKASGQYNTMHLVRNEILEEYPEADIHIVDSESFSIYISRAVVAAAQARDNDKSIEEIIDAFKTEIKKWRCFLLVDTLKYLEKGGRVSKTTAFVGNLLDIKPILTIANGLVESMDKLRGKKKLVEKLIEKIREDADFDAESPEFLLIHSDADKCEKTYGLLEDEFGEGCVKMVSQAGPIIGTHIGKGAIAIVAKIK